MLLVTEKRGAQTVGEQFSWALVAFRGVRDHYPERVRRACRALPLLCNFFNASGTFLANRIAFFQTLLNDLAD